MLLLLNLIDNTHTITNFFKAQPEDVFIFFKKLNVRRNLVRLKSFLNIINVIFLNNDFKTKEIYNLAHIIKNIKIEKMSQLSPTEIKKLIKNEILQLINKSINANT